MPISFIYIPDSFYHVGNEIYNSLSHHQNIRLRIQFPYDMLNKIEAFLDNIAFPAKPEGLYEPITYSLEMGGKRIRPVLTLMAHNMYKPCDDNALSAAAAIAPALGLRTMRVALSADTEVTHIDIVDKSITVAKSNDKIFFTINSPI